MVSQLQIGNIKFIVNRRNFLPSEICENWVKYIKFAEQRSNLYKIVMTIGVLDLMYVQSSGSVFSLLLENRK